MFLILSSRYTRINPSASLAFGDVIAGLYWCEAVWFLLVPYYLPNKLLRFELYLPPYLLYWPQQFSSSSGSAFLPFLTVYLKKASESVELSYACLSFENIGFMCVSIFCWILAVFRRSETAGLVNYSSAARGELVAE